MNETRANNGYRSPMAPMAAMAPMARGVKRNELFEAEATKMEEKKKRILYNCVSKFRPIIRRDLEQRPKPNYFSSTLLLG